MVGIVDSRVQYIYEPIENELGNVIQSLKQLVQSAGPVEGPLLQHSLSTSGKKLRPALTLLSARFHAEPNDSTIVMATAVELLHLASLIHDDTVDNSSTRRGQATISSLWGNKMAVLLGDYLFATSATYVCETNNVRVIRRFSKAIMELAKGEMSEELANHDWNKSVAEYTERIYNKSASLFSTGAECGAILSGANESIIQALKDYGYNLGMAFQIMDDVLDFLGNEDELGKPVGNDLLQGTITLPCLLFVKQYPTHPLVKRLKKGSEDLGDLKNMVELVGNSSLIDDALATAYNYRDQAIRSLAPIERNRSYESLIELAEYVASRRS